MRFSDSGARTHADFSSRDSQKLKSTALTTRPYRLLEMKCVANTIINVGLC